MGNKSKYYQKILCKYSKASGYDFITPAQEVMRKHAGEIDETFLSVTACVTAPVLCSYILWVLQDASERGIDTLLFMARDGFVMYKIAQVICKAWGINIDCRYFYTSRYALRLPMYAVDKKYALEKFCANEAGNDCAETVLASAGLTTSQIDDVLRDIEFTEIHSNYINEDDSSEDIPSKGKLAEVNENGNEKKKLDAVGLEKMKDLLGSCSRFDIYASRVAEEAFLSVSGYFQQNVPRHPEKFAIVDSGWIGSVQECFGKLCHRIFDFSPDMINGYYFGTLAVAPVGSGTYMSFYFSPTMKFHRSVGFCVDLFESLCAADHGKVIGYKESDGQWEPVFASSEEEVSIMQNVEQSCLWGAERQIEMCSDYVDFFIHHDLAILSGINEKYSRMDGTCLRGNGAHLCGNSGTHFIEKLLKSFMRQPDIDESKVFGAIPFSGGVLDGDMTTLARELMHEELWQYSLTGRVVGLLTGKIRKHNKASHVSWVQGSLMLSGTSKLFKLNAKLLIVLYGIKKHLASTCSI